MQLKKGCWQEAVFENPCEESNWVTCEKCGHAWDYRGILLMTHCNSCKCRTLTRPDPCEAIRRKETAMVIVVCEECGHQGKKAKASPRWYCRGCGHTVIFRERRKGGNAKLAIRKNAILLALEKNGAMTSPELSKITGMSVQCVTASAQKLTTTGKLILTKISNTASRCVGWHPVLNSYTITALGLKYLEEHKIEQ